MYVFYQVPFLATGPVATEDLVPSLIFMHCSHNNPMYCFIRGERFALCIDINFKEGIGGLIRKIRD